MSTAITRIQLKYSTGTAAPTSLATAEPAYSYASNTFFIGSPDGNGTIAIGGKFYLDQQQNIYDTANAAFSAANNATDTYVRNHANAAFSAANGAIAVNLTQNNSITFASDTANAAYANANSYITRNEAVNVTQNNSIAAAYTRANNSLSANNGGTVTGDVSITGNLYVTGNVVSISTTEIIANDSLIVLGLGNYSSDIVDIGFAGHYNDGTNAHSGIIRDATSKEYFVFDGYTPEIGANNNIDPNHASFHLSTINANVKSQTVRVKNIDLLPYANGIYDTANAAFTRANNSLNANTGGQVTGNISVGGTITPNADVTWNLGSASNRWHSLFVGSGTIDIGGLTIKNTSVNSIDTATIGGVQDIKLTDAAFGSMKQIASQANAAFNSANASYTRANNSLNANSGGSVSGTVSVTGNVIADYVVANTGFTSSGGTSKLSLSDIGIVAIDVAGVQTKFNASGIENQQGIYGGSFGGNRLSLNNETNLISNRYDTVKIQTGDAGTVVNEFTFANNAFTAPGRITSGSVVAGGINVVPTLASSYNTANSAFYHANAAFTAANNATDTYVRNHANSAFDTANGAVAVNATQNTNITYAWNHANAAFAAANSGSGQAGAYNHANAAFDKANSAYTNAGSAQTTATNAQNDASQALTNAQTAQYTGDAAFLKANAAYAQANTYATASAAVFNGTGDGTTKSFNLGYTPVSDGSASVVTIDGLVQYEGTYTVTTANSSVNFVDAPGSGEHIRVLAYTSVNPYVLGPTGVTAGSYGNASTIAVFTTAANGQLTFATNTAIAIGASQITSGILDVARGGTGAGTFTTNGVLIGQGASAFTTASSSTEGHVLTINSSGVPVFSYINGGTF